MKLTLYGVKKLLLKDNLINHIMKYLMILFFQFTLTLSYGNDSIWVSASSKYQKGFIHHLFFGNHYRKLWATPIKVEIFNRDTLKGGLTPIKMGGNLESQNLRLVDKEGKEYMLRLLIKDPSKATPEFFQRGVKGEIIRDQNSAANPYAAIIIPYLAEGLGLYHCFPKLVYIPKDSNLEEYSPEFVNSLAVLEERPTMDSKNDFGLGKPTKVVSTKAVLKDIYAHQNAKVDQKLFLKCRLFDMLISDWGRHEDQWRWAGYKMGDQIVYEPIPRDRDHAFYKFNDGLFPWLMVHTFQKKFQSFDKSYHNVKGLNLSASFIDHRFLNSVSQNDWIGITNSIQKELTDTIIEQAVKQWPVEIYKDWGPYTASVLKARRNRLFKASFKYYKILNKEVLIPGTDQNEIFVVKRLSNQQTSVLVLAEESAYVSYNSRYEYSDTLYYKVFDHRITKKISLIGLDGSDVFIVEGEQKKGIEVNLIGGEDTDIYFDRSKVSGLSKKTLVVDEVELSNSQIGEETEIVKKNRWAQYSFDRKGYKKHKHLKNKEPEEGKY
jgi:hypothetical protein